ncbi:MAG TPA: ATP-binding protein [Chloroflexota bacterium]
MRSALLTLYSKTWLGFMAALVSVALVSGLLGLIERKVPVGNLLMLYLIPVLAVATLFGRGPAVATSFAAFLAFNFFFVEPRYTFTVADPGELLALLLLLATAGVTGQLAGAQRRQAQEAREGEREAVFLYDVARLLDDADAAAALGAVAERLRLELGVACVRIEINGDDRYRPLQATAGEDGSLEGYGAVGVAGHVLVDGAAPTASRPGGPGRWVGLVPPRRPGSFRASRDDRFYVVPIRADDERVGAMLLLRPADALQFTARGNRLLAATAGQIGHALERDRLRGDATEAEVLRRADDLKTALLHAVSHNLRTPLASILASAGSLLQQDVRWTESQKLDFAETIEQEAQRLNHIVGNLLDLSRMEAGGLRPEKSWYDLGTLIDDVLGRLRPLIGKRQVSVDVPEDLPPVPLDYVEIDQVLSNLLENAVKYTPTDAEIRIGVQLLDGQVQIEIADRGPGIPRGALPHLFEPFYRAATNGSSPQGTGLGLAVAKGLVEAHGGRIWAENVAEGGARFLFTLLLTDSTTASAATSNP